MSDFNIIELNSPVVKKKKKTPVIEDVVVKKKKKKKKVEESEPVKKKKKKVEESEPVKKKKKKKHEVKTSGRTRADILGIPPEEIKVKKTKKKKTVNKESEGSALPSTVDTTVLTTQFDEIYGDKIAQLSVEDREQMEEYFMMFRNLQKIARCFEVKSREGSSKDVYALLKVYEQMREIIADLKALKDISEVADRLQSDVLLPFSRVTVQEFSTFRSEVLKVATRLLPPDKSSEFRQQLDSCMVLAGQNLQAGYENARASIIDLYSEG